MDENCSCITWIFLSITSKTKTCKYCAFNYFCPLPINSVSWFLIYVDQDTFLLAAITQLFHLQSSKDCPSPALWDESNQIYMVLQVSGSSFWPRVFASHCNYPIAANTIVLTQLLFFKCLDGWYLNNA